MKISGDVGPNISGLWNAVNGANVGGPTYFNATGCVYRSARADSGGNGYGSGEGGRLGISASRSSSIFGGSSDVQPSALICLYIVKT